MRGFVPTPVPVVDHMVRLLFHELAPRRTSTVLDAGAGEGAFVDGVLRATAASGWPVPQIAAVENDPRHVATLANRFGDRAEVSILARDFLRELDTEFDYIIANPPYVPLTGLSVDERRSFRSRFSSAVGRFDLYLLFFEQALSALAPGGRLVFVTPEKFLYVGSAAPFRNLLTQYQVEALQFLDEATFGPLVTYPLITMVRKKQARRPTPVHWRDRAPTSVMLRRGARSLLPTLHGVRQSDDAPTLGEVCSRVSCGVATGADDVFTIREAELPSELEAFAYPTLSGRQILPEGGSRQEHVLLVPYARNGVLLREDELGELLGYLRVPARRERLEARTCARRKPWYAFHESPPLLALLRPKLLCKDISARPTFIADQEGAIVPRHSVYYMVPKDPAIMAPLLDYLQSDSATQWLRSHCQRAAKGYLRLQSEVLKQLPVPPELATHGDRAQVRPVSLMAS